LSRYCSKINRLILFQCLLTLTKSIKSCSDCDVRINQRCTVAMIEKNGRNEVSIQFIKKFRLHRILDVVELIYWIAQFK
jgi:hypothetical protein